MPSENSSGKGRGLTTAPLQTNCETFSLQLAGAVDGEELDPTAKSHFETCLRCQAELAHYKKLLRALASLRDQRLAVDDTLVNEILLALQPGGTVHRLQRLGAASRSRKAAYIGGIAAAATAGAAGALVIASRLAARQRLAS
ncbi:MAG: hypothetical protein OEW83_07995 [Acidimicrobiia bacterium]|nr:hypothetical protein [Acidimicrobiia bacterium]